MSQSILEEPEKKEKRVYVTLPCNLNQVGCRLVKVERLLWYHFSWQQYAMLVDGLSILWNRFQEEEPQLCHDLVEG